MTHVSGPPSGSVGSAPRSGGCADTHVMPSASNLGQVVAATLCLINEQRAQAGLSPLSDNGVLDRVARAHSQDMTSRGYFDHVSPGGSSPQSRMMQAGYISNAGAWMIGENIAWGTMSLATPASIVDGWMHSPEHRANILNGRFRDSGIGVSPSAPVRAIGQAGATYTQDFGSIG